LARKVLKVTQIRDETHYDDLQYTRRDWRNRNRIKTPDGTQWLTIPVKVKGQFHQKIRDTVVSDQRWSERHWKTICQNYAKARYFEAVAAVLHDLYRECRDETHLSAINFRFLRTIADMLGIKTRVTWSMDYDVVGGRTERLVHLCRQTGAAEYLSGPAAKSYLDEALFAVEGIRVCWMDYNGYPTYNQLFSPPFIHEVSILDLIMNEGPEGARKYMLSFGDQGLDPCHSSKPQGEMIP